VAQVCIVVQLSRGTRDDLPNQLPYVRAGFRIDVRLRCLALFRSQPGQRRPIGLCGESHLRGIRSFHPCAAWLFTRRAKTAKSSAHLRTRFTQMLASDAIVTPASMRKRPVLVQSRALRRIFCFETAARTSFSSGCTVNAKTATLCAFPTVGQVAPWL
jgi:hypothetical protein